MKSTKPTKTLLSLLLVLIALAVAVSGSATVAAAKSTQVSVNKKVFTAVDTFVSDLPDNGYHYLEAADLNRQLGTAKPPFVIDVRTPADWANGHVPTAVNIPILTLVDNLDKLPAKDKPIVVYCAIGHNGAIGMMSLSLLGYTNVKSMGGGYGAWTDAGLPIAK